MFVNGIFLYFWRKKAVALNWPLCSVKNLPGLIVFMNCWPHIDGLVQERRNFIANTVLNADGKSSKFKERQVLSGSSL